MPSHPWIPATPAATVQPAVAAAPRELPGPTSAELRRRALEVLDTLDADLYYVCSWCAHVVSAPEPPRSCEACLRPLLGSDAYEHPGDAEEASQLILDRREVTS